MNPEEVKKIILAALPEAKVKVADMTGSGDHFDIAVASEAFRGKTLMDQHKVLYAILDHEMKNRIHAVKLRTSLP